MYVLHMNFTFAMGAHNQLTKFNTNLCRSWPKHLKLLVSKFIHSSSPMTLHSFSLLVSLHFPTSPFLTVLCCH